MFATHHNLAPEELKRVMEWSNMTENEFKTEVESLYESTFPIQHVRLEKTAEKLRKLQNRKSDVILGTP